MPNGLRPLFIFRKVCWELEVSRTPETSATESVP